MTATALHEKTVRSENGESWTKYAILAGHLGEDEAIEFCYANGYEHYYGGPGRGFAGFPGVQHLSRAGVLEAIAEAGLGPVCLPAGDEFTLVTHSGGIDV